LFPLRWKGELDGIHKMNPVLPAGVEGFLYDPEVPKVIQRYLEDRCGLLLKSRFLLRQRKIEGGNPDGHLNPNLTYFMKPVPWERRFPWPWNFLRVNPQAPRGTLRVSHFREG
jgi:hypothetical protein